MPADILDLSAYRRRRRALELLVTGMEGQPLIERGLLIILHDSPGTGARAVSAALWTHGIRVGDARAKAGLRSLESQGLVLRQRGSGWHLAEEISEVVERYTDDLMEGRAVWRGRR